MKPLFATETNTAASTIAFQDITPAAVPAVIQPKVPVRAVTDNEIDQLGQKVSSHAAKTASQIMAQVRASDVDGFGDKLNELVAVSKRLDPKKMGNKGLINKVMNLFGESKEALLAQYQTVEQRMNALVGEMDKTVVHQQKRVGDLEQMYADNEAAFHQYGAEIEACQMILEALKAQLANEQQAQDAFAAQRQQDLMNRIHRAEKKEDDFVRGQQLCKLAAPEIRAMQDNARSLVTTFTDIKNTTVPAWQGVFSRYILSMEQKRAAELATSVQNATNEAFRMQADQLRQNVQTIATAKERSVVDIETLEHMQQQLLGAIDDAKRIADEGARSRAEARVKLADMDKQMIARAALPQLTK
jgi:uncharacterized protein YaaN involved in tellurite resistance